MCVSLRDREIEKEKQRTRCLGMCLLIGMSREKERERERERESERAREREVEIATEIAFQIASGLDLKSLAIRASKAPKCSRKIQPLLGASWLWCYSAKDSTPSMTGRRFQRTMEMIPRPPLVV